MHKILSPDNNLLQTLFIKKYNYMCYKRDLVEIDGTYILKFFDLFFFIFYFFVCKTDSTPQLVDSVLLENANCGHKATQANLPLI